MKIDDSSPSLPLDEIIERMATKDLLGKIELMSFDDGWVEVQKVKEIIERMEIDGSIRQKINTYLEERDFIKGEFVEVLSLGGSIKDIVDILTRAGKITKEMEGEYTKFFNEVMCLPRTEL